MAKAILIDGNSLMFRSYYATAYTGNLMKNSSGLYTNAVFGFCNMITKVLDSEYDYIFVAFDKGKHTFRHLAYDDYKGGRKPMPDEFRVQIPYIKKYLDVLNIKHEELDDYEADDLIASVATMMKNNNVDDIMIITGDKDLLQLVEGNVHVSLTKKGITELEDYNKDNFFDLMGFNPNQIPDYKGLKGDSSDNLPGIKGIGDKTALKLLAEYNTLENIGANVNNIKGKTGELIKEGIDIGLKCKELATLVRDIKLDFNEKDIEKKDYDKDKLIEFYNELEFKSFIKRLENKDGETSNEEIVEEKAEDVFVDFKIIDDINYDFSTLGDRYLILEDYLDNYYNNEFLGIGLFSPFNDIFDNDIFVPYDVVIKSDSFKEYLKSNTKKITFDYKRLYVELKKHDIEINNVSDDLLLAAYLVNPKYASDDFKEVIDHFKKFNIEAKADIYGSGAKVHVPEIDVYARYALKKAKCLYLVLKDITDKINELELNDLYKLEINLSEVLGDMEIDGLIVDRNKLISVGDDLGEKLSKVQDEIYKLAGKEFNINSVKQLGEVLFEDLNLPHDKKNKTGYSTSVEVLEKLAYNYEIAAKVLEYRAYSKLISTYVNGLGNLIDRHSFIHPLYKQALTLTGRLSSVEPNIQNMPIRTELGQIIRDVFTSRFNNKILSVDYSQIELRVLAHMSDDQPMIDAFNSDKDFHSETASYIFGVDPKMVTKEMRRTAKAINFGIVYGMSAWGLSESIHISPKEASQYISKYFERHQKIDEFLHKVISDAKECGYTKTMFNRVRYIDELKSMNRNIYNFGERTAMNAPIQGSAADIIKMAMVNVSKALKKHNLNSIMIAQVHDELVFDVYPGEEEILEKLVVSEMENVVKLKVKLIAKASSGESWLYA